MAAFRLFGRPLPIHFALLGRKRKYIKSKTTAKLAEKRTSIAAVRDILWTFGTFPTSLLSRYRLPLRCFFDVDTLKEIYNNMYLIPLSQQATIVNNYSLARAKNTSLNFVWVLASPPTSLIKVFFDVNTLMSLYSDVLIQWPTIRNPY